MAVVAMKQLLEAGVHFGHQTRRWDPKMAEYIFQARNGIHIIDLQKTSKKLDEAYAFVKEQAEEGKTVLFVGTKKQAQECMKEAALKCGMFYVDQRWLGGMLTNFGTIQKRIQRLKDLEAMEQDGTFDVLPKKEVILLKKEMEKLERNLGGIKEMNELPGVIFLVDPKKERIAILEAKKLNIPIEIFNSDIFEASERASRTGQGPCYLCARMRRGALYSKAEELGCNKLALGHHFDDVIETIVMGMLYGAQIQTMMPKLHSTNFPGMELIRPLYLVREDDIIHWARYNDLHFIQCACRFTENCASCGGTEKGSKRAEIKAMIHELERQNPYVAKNIFRSVENVNLNTVIGYKKDGIRHNFLDTYDNIADER